MTEYGISYVKKHRGLGNINGFNLFVKYIKAGSEEHAEARCRIPEQDIRSIWRVA